MTEKLHCCVIGAGIVGASCALELLRDGHAVTLLDPANPGGEQAASYGNGTLISPASVVPMSMPGLWKKVPGYLLDADGPLTIRWSALPALAPWLLRFIRAGSSVAKVQATARALSGLLHDAPSRHRALALQIGQPELIASRGLLYAYPDRGAFEAEALAWELRRQNGLSWQELDAAALHSMAPALSDSYRFGVLLPQGAHCLDPGRYVASMVTHAVSRGASLRREQALGLEIKQGRLLGVRTAGGTISCDRAIVAAGANSAALVRAAGDRVMLQSERGYHVSIEAPDLDLPIPVIPSDTKTANCATARGFRVAGQVELARPGAAPNWRRSEILLRQALSCFPQLPPDLSEARVKRWMGNRPSTPDGLPVLGPALACSGLFHAFGHGHVGLASAPASARLVADMIGAKAGALDPVPYSVRRFN